MKIIRPEYTPPKVEEKQEIELIDDNTYKEEENPSEQKKEDFNALMEKTIDENKIKVEIILTKRQYELWNKKGGEKWLKKKLVGQKK